MLCNGKRYGSSDNTRPRFSRVGGGVEFAVTVAGIFWADWIRYNCGQHIFIRNEICIVLAIFHWHLCCVVWFADKFTPNKWSAVDRNYKGNCKYHSYHSSIWLLTFLRNNWTWKLTYMRRFGYLASNSAVTEIVFHDDAFVGAVKDMQRFGGLQETGQLDDNTLKVSHFPIIFTMSLCSYWIFLMDASSCAAIGQASMRRIWHAKQSFGKPNEAICNWFDGMAKRPNHILVR